MKAYACWLGASALALCWSGNAAAQTAPATPAPQDNGTAATDNGDAPGDIVITAQRRNEDLMKTAVSASVLTGTQLENKGVVNVDALQFAMPSVVVNNFGQGNDFNVRGIGKAEHNTQTTTGVITYRDGVPTFPGYVQGEPYYDIANIQVLRGPQGTIVGQNATGGAVFINTNDPIIGGGYRGYVQLQYGNYNDAGAQGALNIPVSDTFAARIALYGERRDGYYNVTGPTGAKFNDANNKLGLAAGRISFLWKPDQHFSVLSKTDLGYLDFGAYPASPYLNNFRTLPGTSTPNPNYSDLLDITANYPQGARDKFVRSILKIEYDTDNGTKFRSVTGIQNANTMYKADLDGTATGDETFFDSVDETQFSQEFNIISPDNQRVTWLLGAFGLWNTYVFPAPYDNFTIDVCHSLNLAACKYQLKGRNPERNLALFGQIGFNITNNLKLEAGGRYTASRSINHVDVLQYGLYIRDDQEVTSNNFSYKVSLGWKASSSQYLYAFVASGFRPGGLNVPVGLGLPAPFKPETVTSYEAGWKGNFLGGKLRTTLTGFYNDYRNFQVIIGYPTYPTFGIELNVPGKTKIYGFEGEIEFHSGGFSFDAGINVLHSELGTFYASDPRVPATGACDPSTGSPTHAANCVNLNGREQTYAPNFTFNVGAQYEIPVGTSDKIIPRVNFGHIAPQWATLFENPALGDRLGERNVLNAQLAWQHGKWTVTAYATNLIDQHYAGALNSGLYFAGPPRQYGIKLLKTF
ncbi:MAG: TonB-dependent receptor [Sphingomonas sp.]|uniref:TonB-dependent receptor n=1 Tax=Sphingomonas sp. TaxID=28214 RepID=UPI003F7DD507